MFVKLVTCLPASIKSINPHITESFACTRKILAFMFLLPTNGTFRNQNQNYENQNYENKQFHFCYKTAIQCLPTSAYSSRFITCAPSFIFLGRFFLEKTQLNLGSF